MSMPRCLAACLSALMLAACAGTPAQDPGLATATPAAPAPDTEAVAAQVAGIQTLASRLPRALLGFEWQGANATAGAENGWTARYRHTPSGATATVFLRPPRNPPLPDGPASPAVQVEVTAHALAVQALLGGSGGALTRVPDYGAGLNGGTPLLRCADLRQEAGERRVRRELVCSTGVNGMLLTVMLSARHRQEDMDLARRFLSAFALGVLLDLRQEAGPGDQPPAEISGRLLRV